MSHACAKALRMKGVDMKISDKAVVMLAANEGIVPAPYPDSVGVWTYGVGHTSGAGEPYPATMPRGMPDDLEAAITHSLRLFKSDLAKYEDRVNRALTRKPKQHQFDAMVLFDYNTGGIFKAKLTKHFNAGDDDSAAVAFMSWSKPTEIIPRRREQQALFRDGVYALDPVNIWNADNRGRVIWKPVRTLTAKDAMKLIDTATATTKALPAVIGGAAGAMSEFAGLPPAATVAIAIVALVLGYLIIRKVTK